jgi:hypothetical protein
LFADVDRSVSCCKSVHERKDGAKKEEEEEELGKEEVSRFKPNFESKFQIYMRSSMPHLPFDTEVHEPNPEPGAPSNFPLLACA